MAKYNIGDSRVIESREGGDGLTIRRRRESPDGQRFTTYERLEQPNLAVIKKNGERELFDRTKLSTAVRQSVGKFFRSEEEVEEIISQVEEGLYALGESDVSSQQIGDQVLEALGRKNEVAYVRFASVYHDFKTLDEFEAILTQQREKNQRQKTEKA